MVDAVPVAGGIGRRAGPALAERAAARPPAAPAATVPDLTGARATRARAVVTRHCWVTGLPDGTGRCAGLLVEWRQEPGIGRWSGRVVYVVDDGGRSVLVEAWVDADHLGPA
jgi:hypothetical protein